MLQLARVQATHWLADESRTWPEAQTQVVPLRVKVAGHWQAPLLTTNGLEQAEQTLSAWQEVQNWGVHA